MSDKKERRPIHVTAIQVSSKSLALTLINQLRFGLLGIINAISKQTCQNYNHSFRRI